MIIFPCVHIDREIPFSLQLELKTFKKECLAVTPSSIQVEDIGLLTTFLRSLLNAADKELL